MLDGFWCCSVSSTLSSLGTGVVWNPTGVRIGGLGSRAGRVSAWPIVISPASNPVASRWALLRVSRRENSQKPHQDRQSFEPVVQEEGRQGTEMTAAIASNSIIHNLFFPQIHNQLQQNPVKSFFETVHTTPHTVRNNHKTRSASKLSNFLHKTPTNSHASISEFSKHTRRLLTTTARR